MPARVFAFLLAFATLAVGAGFAARDRDSHSRTVHVRQFGLAIEVPERFYVRRFSGFDANGLVVTNDPRVRSPLYVPALRHIRRNAAVLTLFAARGLADSSADSRFPIRPSTLATADWRRRPHGSRLLERPVVGNGWRLGLEAYFGPLVSSADERAVMQIVRSVRFRRVRTGEVLGSGVAVGRPASTYRVRSAERYDDGLLVRAPGGFYTVRNPLQWDGSICRLQFDRVRVQFYCRGRPRVRWDRTGHAVDPLARIGASKLDLGYASVGQDGHVLIGGFPRESEQAFERRLWRSR